LPAPCHCAIAGNDRAEREIAFRRLLEGEAHERNVLLGCRRVDGAGDGAGRHRQHSGADRADNQMAAGRVERGAEVSAHYGLPPELDIYRPDFAHPSMKMASA
jgi:hypothetical protein